MIAVSFFDAVASGGSTIASLDLRQFGEVVMLAKRYMDSALADWGRVLECERQFTSTEYRTPGEQSRDNRSLSEVYQKWAGEAEQVLMRTRQLAGSGLPVDNAEALADAFGRVQARLKMTPEMFDRAREQIRQGQGIPMEKLRNGLPARIRA